MVTPDEWIDSPEGQRAVEVMANAAWNGSNELKITHNQYDGIARKMLRALLATPVPIPDREEAPGVTGGTP